MVTEPRIRSVEPQTNLDLKVEWIDGSIETIDLRGLIESLKVLAPLRDPNLFRRAEVADWGWAIRWSDQIDLSADTLAELSAKAAMRP